MSYGLEVWDENGNQTLSIEDRITRLIGTVNLGLHNGSLTDSALLTGAPFYAVVNSVYTDPGESIFYWPQITFSGGTLQWTFSGGTTDPIWHTRVNCTIIYGVY